MKGLCEGRVAVVTGAGRGIGRACALALAEEGAQLVVNDLGVELDGSGQSSGPAAAVVAEISALGGAAVASTADVADDKGASSLVALALEAFGQIDVLINNAGILRDRMLVNMSEDDWDDVIRIHLRGCFLPTRAAARHWRNRSKLGSRNAARVINVTSPSGLFGNPGQTNYGAAKAGVAAFTIIASMELQRYGVTVNAISPGARTRMTAPLGKPDDEPAIPGQFDARDPANIAPIVVWLASEQSSFVTGRIFAVSGGSIAVAEGWSTRRGIDRKGPLKSHELGQTVRELISDSSPIES